MSGSAAETTLDPVLAAALEQVAETGWNGLTMHAVAEAAGLPPAEVYRRYPDREALLTGFFATVDAEVLAGLEAEAAAPPDMPADTEAPADAEAPAESAGPPAAAPADSVRERLLDIMMRRFDVLEAYRPVVAALAEDLPRDPVAALCGVSAGLRSMRWMLEAADVDAHGLSGLIRAKGLLAVYANALWVWLGDTSPDRGPTMRALDTGLKRLEGPARLLGRLESRVGVPRPPAAPGPGTAGGA